MVVTTAVAQPTGLAGASQRSTSSFLSELARISSGQRQVESFGAESPGSNPGAQPLDRHTQSDPDRSWT